MLEGSAGDGVVYIPNETQPPVRGTRALKQPELCAGDSGKQGAKGDGLEHLWCPAVATYLRFCILPCLKK